MKIHILGSSGSGTTSLAISLSRYFNCKHFDSDNYYWKKTKIPFTEKNTIEKRHDLLLSDMKGLSSWVLSGSMDSWSDPFEPLFDAVIFLEASNEIREKRLKERELEKFGSRILLNGDMHDEHEFFIKWAGQYEDGSLGGRSRKRHEAWLRKIKCPIIRATNESTFDNLVQKTLFEIKKIPI